MLMFDKKCFSIDRFICDSQDQNAFLLYLNEFTYIKYIVDILIKLYTFVKLCPIKKIIIYNSYNLLK